MILLSMQPYWVSGICPSMYLDGSFLFHWHAKRLLLDVPFSIDFNTSIGWILAQAPEFTRLEVYSILDDIVFLFKFSALVR